MYLKGITLQPRAYVAAVARKPTQLDLFVCGQDGHVYTTWWSRDRGWHDKWKDIGRSFPSDTHLTVIARKPEQLDLFASAKDGNVYTCWWTKGRDWSGLSQGWKSLGGRSHRKTASANVAAVSRNPDSLDVFFCGDNGKVYYKSWTHRNKWDQDWRNLGPSPLQSGAFITAVSRRPDHLDLFACGSDGRVYTSWWRESDPQWSGVRQGWKCLGGHFQSRAYVNAVAREPEHLDVFVIGKNGFMYNTWWHRTFGWHDWSEMRGHSISGGRTASLSRSPETVDLFLSDDDGHVYTTWGRKQSDRPSISFAKWRSLGILTATWLVPKALAANNVAEGQKNTIPDALLLDSTAPLTGAKDALSQRYAGACYSYHVADYY